MRKMDLGMDEMKRTMERRLNSVHRSGTPLVSGVERKFPLNRIVRPVPMDRTNSVICTVSPSHNYSLRDSTGIITHLGRSSTPLRIASQSRTDSDPLHVNDPISHIPPLTNRNADPWIASSVVISSAAPVELTSSTQLQSRSTFSTSSAAAVSFKLESATSAIIKKQNAVTAAGTSGVITITTAAGAAISIITPTPTPTPSGSTNIFSSAKLNLGTTTTTRPNEIRITRPVVLNTSTKQGPITARVQALPSPAKLNIVITTSASATIPPIRVPVKLLQQSFTRFPRTSGTATATAIIHPIPRQGSAPDVRLKQSTRPTVSGGSSSSTAITYAEVRPKVQPQTNIVRPVVHKLPATVTRPIQRSNAQNVETVHRNIQNVETVGRNIQNVEITEETISPSMVIKTSNSASNERSSNVLCKPSTGTIDVSQVPQLNPLVIVEAKLNTPSQQTRQINETNNPYQRVMIQHLQQRQQQQQREQQYVQQQQREQQYVQQQQRQQHIQQQQHQQYAQQQQQQHIQQQRQQHVQQQQQQQYAQQQPRQQQNVQQQQQQQYAQQQPRQQRNVQQQQRQQQHTQQQQCQQQHTQQQQRQQHVQQQQRQQHHAQQQQQQRHAQQQQWQQQHAQQQKRQQQIHQLQQVRREQSPHRSSSLLQFQQQQQRQHGQHIPHLQQTYQPQQRNRQQEQQQQQQEQLQKQYEHVNQQRAVPTGYYVDCVTQQVYEEYTVENVIIEDNILQTQSSSVPPQPPKDIQNASVIRTTKGAAYQQQKQQALVVKEPPTHSSYTSGGHCSPVSVVEREVQVYASSFLEPNSPKISGCYAGVENVQALSNEEQQYNITSSQLNDMMQIVEEEIVCLSSDELSPCHKQKEQQQQQFDPFMCTKEPIYYEYDDSYVLEGCTAMQEPSSAIVSIPEPQQPPFSLHFLPPAPTSSPPPPLPPPAAGSTSHAQTAECSVGATKRPATDDQGITNSEAIRMPNQCLQTSKKKRKKNMIKKKRFPLQYTYKHQWKSKFHPVESYEELKRKEEKKQTFNDILNQKGLLSKLRTWRMYRISNEFRELMDVESSYVLFVKYMTDLFESKKISPELKCDMYVIVELLKGLLQRSKVISAQLSEVNIDFLQLLNHKRHVKQLVKRFYKPKKKSCTFEKDVLMDNIVW